MDERKLTIETEEVFPLVNMKVMATVFDPKRFVLVEFMGTGEMIIVAVYCQTLQRLRRAAEKKPERDKRYFVRVQIIGNKENYTDLCKGFSELLDVSTCLKPKFTFLFTFRKKMINFYLTLHTDCSLEFKNYSEPALN
ncbi:hypothetical protein AVEN_187386-1 [Araneus ventricosus]|uniref:Uncharacterized protein n=1 Tax=Araneus ventricosus TaxID=182803 RepID=A0A4Y2Q4A1_ARAVE|nr:hypothetical protein AVEN_187386-1 [Araneus ventricosus]